MFNLPEAFYTINIIPSISLWNVPIVWLAGVGFVLAVIGFFVANKFKFNFSQTQINNKLLILAFIFWMPIFAISFYNNIYDLKENIIDYQGSLEAKQAMRLCNMEKIHQENGHLCQLFPSLNYAHENFPIGSVIKIPSSSLLPYFSYYFYPDLVIQN